MRILVVAGPSGGHIFPALNFLEALKERRQDADTLLVLPAQRKFLCNGLADRTIKYISISTVKLNADFNNLIAVWRLLKGILESFFILLEFQPDIVVGFGSLASLPVIFFAWIFRTKTLIHEQNVVVGRANRLLARFTDKIAISFPETRACLKNYPERKIAITGNPAIRKGLIKLDKEKASGFFRLDCTKFTILVMGGSQGSHRINIEFSKTLPLLAYRSRLQIIHLSGKDDYALLRENYANSDINVKLFEFLEPMHYAYSAADLIVSRAGAATIAELIFFGLPAIIIPYPFAYKHQMSNAKILENSGSAILIKDNKMDADILKQIIEDLFSNPGKLKKMRCGYGDLPVYKADDLLVKEVLSLI